MALLDTQKTQILFYLGWPGRSIQVGSQVYNSVVNDRLTNLPTTVESIAITMIRGLNDIDEKIRCALTRLSASQVQDIRMNGKEIDQLRSERLRQIRELSDLLDIPVMRSGGVHVGISV